MRVTVKDPTGDDVDVAYVGKMLADQGVPHAIITRPDDQQVIIEAGDLVMPRLIATIAGLGLDARPYRGGVDVPSL